MTCDGQAVEAVTFRVIDAKKISGKAPSPEYVRHIIKGLRSFGVPESYVDHVIDVSVANITAADSKPKDARADVEAMRLNSLKAALTLFNEKADRLEARSFTNKIANSGVTLSGSLGQPAQAFRHGPDEEAIDAFVLTMRFFVQDNETISFRNMADVYSVLPVTKELTDKFNDARSKTNAGLDSATPISLNGTTLTSRVVFDTFLYGGLAHANAGKKATFDSWFRNPTLSRYYRTSSSSLSAFWRR